MDEFTKKYIKLIKLSKTDKKLKEIIDSIYEDGLHDGEETNYGDETNYGS